MKLLQIVIICGAMLMSSACVRQTNTTIDDMPQAAEAYYSNYTTADYDTQCPYGDAVIVDKDEMDFLGKAVGVGVECVNYDAASKQWVTWNTNAKDEKMFQVWSPKQYRVFTMDGELVVKNGKPVVVEYKGQ